MIFHQRKKRASTAPRKMALSRIGQAFLLLSSCLVTEKVVNANEHQSAKKPNFVWLVSEDNSKHYLKLYNKLGAKMPNVESLAKEGLVFNNAFSNAPVCSTARTTLALGAYGPRLNTQYHRAYEKSALPQGLQPISVLLKNAGYYTSNAAKDDFNFVEQGKSWDHVSGKASWRNRKAGQPFFHMQSFYITHEGQLHFPASDVTDKPTKHDPNKVDLAPIYPNTSLFRYTHARYLDQHVTLDKQIGQVLNKLKADGLLEDTFVFYFGDHGGALPGSKGYINERGLNVPLVVRIPKNFKHLVSKDIAKLKNSRINGFVSFIDFAPTLLSLAGEPVNEQHDGKAFLTKNINLKALNQQDTTFSYADRFDEKYDLVRSVRQGNLKYVRHYQPFNADGLFNIYRYKQAAYREWKDLFKAGKLTKKQAAFFETKPPEALYDISKDPYETNNLANKASYTHKLLVMRSKLTNKLKSLPDLGFYPESYKNSGVMTQAVDFGHGQQAYIAKMIDIANLQLLTFEQAKPQLLQALTSSDAWFRYWGLNTLSYFGSEAKALSTQVKKIMRSDKEPLNRARAIAFLASTKQLAPQKAIEALIADTENDITVLEILNIATQLHDSLGVRFNIDMKPHWSLLEKSQEKKNKMLYVWLISRIEYLK